MLTKNLDVLTIIFSHIPDISNTSCLLFDVCKNFQDVIIIKLKNYTLFDVLKFNVDITIKNKIVKILIDNGCDVNAKNNDGLTALMVAAENGHAKCVELLIDKSDVNAKNNYGETALIFANEHKHAECVKLLNNKS